MIGVRVRNSRRVLSNWGGGGDGWRFRGRWFSAFKVEKFLGGSHGQMKLRQNKQHKQHHQQPVRCAHVIVSLHFNTGVLVHAVDALLEVHARHGKERGRE